MLMFMAEFGVRSQLICRNSFTLKFADRKKEMTIRLLDIDDKRVLDEIEFAMNGSGLFDIDELNDEAKRRFENGLRQAAKGRVVQGNAMINKATKKWNIRLSGQRRPKKTSTK